MRPLSFISMLMISMLSLNACVSSIKPDVKPLDYYDFGLQSADKRVELSLPLEHLGATDAIQHGNIRYRLHYKNPAQVFTYAESRWSTLPVDLVRQKLTVNTVTNSGCSLKLQIVAFDQVFDDEQHSRGVVQLQAGLIDKRSRKLIASRLVSAQTLANTPNARGGVAALDVASSDALQQAASWAKDTSQSSSECQLATP